MSSEDSYSREVVAADVLTRKVVKRYRDVSAAAEDAGVPRSKLYGICWRHSFPRGGSLMYRFLDEFDPEEEWSFKSPTPLYVTDGRRLRCFYTIDEAARLFGVRHKTVEHYLNVGIGKGLRWGRVKRGLGAALRELEGL